MFRETGGGDREERSGETAMGRACRAWVPFIKQSSYDPLGTEPLDKRSHLTTPTAWKDTVTPS